MTEGNEGNSSQNKLLFNDEFVSYINSLSDSIKEYFKVTSNVNKNKNILINSLESDLISLMEFQTNESKKVKDTISLLKLEINSDEKNLSLFFEDMKILFKKMKVKQQALKNNAINSNYEAPPNPKSDIDSLTNKISLLEKQISDDNQSNKKLKDEHDKLKNSYQLEISKLSETNTKLSLSLVKKQKELVNLQKEIFEKTQEIENFKKSIKSKDNEEKTSLINSIKSIFEEDEIHNSYKPLNNFSESVNKIIENYKAENELLKNKQKNFEDKMKEVDNINKDINYKLSSLQELYTQLMEEKKQLIEEIAVKDIKIIKILFEKEKYKDEIDKLNDIKLSSGFLEDDNNNESNIKDKFIQLNKKLKQEKEEKKDLKEEIEKLKSECEKYKNKLLSLGVNYIAGQEVEISKENIIENLTEQIEQLKQKNQTLSEAFESLTSQFWNNNNTQNEKI
jgi:DNA repair exonuclease SbcCD ATPase subunit